MSTYNSTDLCGVNEKPCFKCKKYIIDPVTGRGILNPEWTPEQDQQLKELTKPKKKNVQLRVQINALFKSHYKKELPVIFKNNLTPQQFLELLRAYKKAGQMAKINTLGYLANCIVIHKIKKLYPTQGHIGSVIGITRVWANETLSALEEDGCLNSLYRFLCSKLYSMASAIFDPSIREELSEFFPWIKYHDNKAVMAEFTHSYNFNIKNINNKDLGLTSRGELGQKETKIENFSPMSSNIQDLLKKLTGGLCPSK